MISRSQVLSTVSQRDVDGGRALHHLSNQFLPRDYSSYEAFKGMPLSESHLTSNAHKASSNDLIIGWNDMFDEELIIDVLQPPPSPLHLPSSVPLELPAPLTSITFNKDATFSGASTESNVSEVLCNETINTGTKNSSKSKSIQPKIDAAMKKIKRAKLDPSDKWLRLKQNYTMSVKNRLADIASTRPLEEEVAEAVGGSARGFGTQNAVKVVQSRLANKGGVMKFGIPKNVGTTRVTKRKKESFPRESAPAATAQLRQKLPWRIASTETSHPSP